MLDIGFSELFLVAVITLIVVGPHEIPRVVRTVSALMRKVRHIAGDFQSSLTDIANETDIKNIKKNLEQELTDSDIKGNEFDNVLQNIYDPDNALKNAQENASWFKDAIHNNSLENSDDVSDYDVADAIDNAHHSSSSTTNKQTDGDKIQPPDEAASITNAKKLSVKKSTKKIPAKKSSTPTKVTAKKT